MSDFIIRGTFCGSFIADIYIRDGVVERLSECSGGAERFLVPGGLMELHCHGAAGHKTTELNRRAYEDISIFLARHGVTSFLATFSAAPLEVMLSYLAFAGKIMGEGLPGARLDGVYMEGPCLKNAGGMSPELLRAPSPKETRELLSAGRGIMRIMTVAPEVPGAMELIETLSENGVAPSAGHSSASAAQIRQAVKHGLRHITHLGNNHEGDIRCAEGCYRHEGPLLEALCDDSLTTEVIADGVHIMPSLVKIFYRVKGPDKCAAVTDICAAAGLEGEKLLFPNPIGKMEEFTVKNGALYIGGTERLTGSLLTMERAFMNIQNFAGLSSADAAKSCGSVPRGIAGLPPRAEIAPGMKIDFTILSADGQVELTAADGKIIYQKPGVFNE
jgi:N-acetylglucosamine-6-phosphate deacetylase